MNARPKSVRWHILTVVVVLLATTAALISASRMIRRPFAHGDFGVYLHASRLLLAHENIYAIPTPPESGGLYYVYPPLLAFLFVPLTWISEDAAIVLWCLFSVFLVWWIVRRSHEVLTGGPLSALEPATRWIVGGLSVLFSARFVLHHLDRGQANLAAIALALLGMSVVHRRPTRAVLGGAIIGFSIAFKAVTLPFVLWYLLTDRRVLTGIALGLAIGLLMPALMIGVQSNFLLLDHWIHNYLLNSGQQQANLALGYNFSIHAQLERFFTPVDSFTIGNQPHSLMILHASDSWLRAADWIIRLGLAAVIAGFYFRFRKSPAIVLRGGIALVFALTPLFFPTAQKNYFVFLLPAYIYVFHVLYTLKVKDRTLAWLTWASFITATLTAGAILGDTLSDMLAAAGFILLGDLLVATAVLRAAWVSKSFSQGF